MDDDDGCGWVTKVMYLLGQDLHCGCRARGQPVNIAVGFCIDGGGYLYREGCAPGAGRAGTATWVLVDQGEWSGAEWQWRWWEEGKRQAKSTRVQRRDLGHTRETGAKTGRSNRAAGDNNSNRHVRCMYRVPDSRRIFYLRPWYWVRCIMLCGGTKGPAGSGDGDGERVSCMEPWFGARLGRASYGGWSRYSGRGTVVEVL